MLSSDIRKFDRRPVAMGKNADIGLRIGQARQARGMGQVQLARAVGIAQSRISEYESGKTRLRTELLERFAEVLDVPVTWLLTGEGDSPLQALPQRVSADVPEAPTWIAQLTSAVKATEDAIEFQRQTFVAAVEQQGANYAETVRGLMTVMSAMLGEIRGLREDFQRAISGPDEAREDPSASPAPSRPAPTRSAAADVRREHDEVRKGKRPSRGVGRGGA
jgi:transcriptional regulator with XRE-family HTH domain